MSSVILAYALATGLSCQNAFLTTIFELKKENVSELIAFANVACKTNNPDYIWQIAYVESYFDPTVIRVNDPNGAKILRGEEANSFLGNIESGNSTTKNIDLGILQINWAAHRHEFNQSPEQMISPVNQVRYLVSSMSKPLFQRCGDLWVGCYHSWSNHERAVGYSDKAKAAQKKLMKIVEKLQSKKPDTTFYSSHSNKAPNYNRYQTDKKFKKGSKEFRNRKSLVDIYFSDY